MMMMRAEGFAEAPSVGATLIRSVAPLLLATGLATRPVALLLVLGVGQGLSGAHLAGPQAILLIWLLIGGAGPLSLDFLLRGGLARVPVWAVRAISRLYACERRSRRFRAPSWDAPLSRARDRRRDRLCHVAGAPHRRVGDRTLVDAPPVLGAPARPGDAARGAAAVRTGAPNRPLRRGARPVRSHAAAVAACGEGGGVALARWPGCPMGQHRAADARPCSRGGPACRRRGRRLRRHRGRACAPIDCLPDHAHRPTQPLPVPAAPIPGGNRGVVAGRYRDPHPQHPARPAERGRSSRRGGWCGPAPRVRSFCPRSAFRSTTSLSRPALSTVISGETNGRLTPRGLRASRMRRRCAAACCWRSNRRRARKTQPNVKPGLPSWSSEADPPGSSWPARWRNSPAPASTRSTGRSTRPRRGSSWSSPHHACCLPSLRFSRLMPNGRCGSSVSRSVRTPR